MPTVKEEVKQLLDTLPDDCSLEDVQYHLLRYREDSTWRAGCRSRRNLFTVGG